MLAAGAHDQKQARTARLAVGRDLLLLHGSHEEIAVFARRHPAVPQPGVCLGHRRARVASRLFLDDVEAHLYAYVLGLLCQQQGLLVCEIGLIESIETHLQLVVAVDAESDHEAAPGTHTHPATAQLCLFYHEPRHIGLKVVPAQTGRARRAFGNQQYDLRLARNVVAEIAQVQLRALHTRVQQQLLIICAQQQQQVMRGVLRREQHSMLVKGEQGMRLQQPQWLLQGPQSVPQKPCSAVVLIRAQGSRSCVHVLQAQHRAVPRAAACFALGSEQVWHSRVWLSAHVHNRCVSGVCAFNVGQQLCASPTLYCDLKGHGAALVLPQPAVVCLRVIGLEGCDLHAHHRQRLRVCGIASLPVFEEQVRHPQCEEARIIAEVCCVVEGNCMHVLHPERLQHKVVCQVADLLVIHSGGHAHGYRSLLTGVAVLCDVHNREAQKQRLDPHGLVQPAVARHCDGDHRCAFVHTQHEKQLPGAADVRVLQHAVTCLVFVVRE